MSLTIEFDDDKITKLSWDHKWVDCSSSSCIADSDGNANCFYPDDSTCTDWNPRIFITWKGKDSTGARMQSESYSFERYKDYAISSYYQNAIGK